MSELHKGQSIELSIQSINAYGIGFLAEKGVSFEVPKAFPGEKVEALLEEKFYPATWRARVQKVLKPSAERVQSPCVHSGDCQGCSLDVLDYQKQLEIKNSRVAEIFPEAKPILGSAKIWNYRSSAYFIFKKQSKKVVLTYSAKGSADFFAVHSCRVVPENFNEIIQTIQKLANQFEFSVFNPTISHGYFVGVELRYSFAENKVMLIFHTKTEDMKEKQKIIDALVAKHPELVSIYHIQESCGKKQNRHVFGEKFIVEKWESGLKYRIAPFSIFYPNLFQAQGIFEWMKKELRISGREKILELFCGSGIFSLAFAACSKMVYGLERNTGAVREAISNTHFNNTENVIFIEQKIDSLTVGDDILKDSIDILLLKPPREIPSSVIEVLKVKEIPKIMLIYSNLETLAAEIEKFKNLGYGVEKIQPFDLYPHSYHIETVVFLRKKKKILIKRK